MNLGSVHGSVHGFVHGLESHSDHLKLSLIMFSLNMMDYTVFFPVLSTLTWDTLLTLRSTWGFYLNHLIPLRPFKSVFDNVLLEHGGLPHVLPLAVHLIFLPEQAEGVILSHFYSLSFLVRGLLHA